MLRHRNFCSDTIYVGKEIFVLVVRDIVIIDLDPNSDYSFAAYRFGPNMADGSIYCDSQTLIAGHHSLPSQI